MTSLPPIGNSDNGEARRDAAHPPQPADPAPAADPLDNLAGRNRAMNDNKQKSWENLEKAIRLVGAASESADIPANLRGELINALAALVWVSQSIRCPACRCWRKKGCER